MRALLALASLLLSGAAPGNAAPIPHSTRIRTIDSIARAAFDRGQRGSPLFAWLVEEVEHSDLIVSVGVSIRLPESIGGQLFFVSRAPTDDRFVRIRLNVRAAPLAMTATLAHELQHAIEVARDPGVQDDAGLERLYRAIGTQSPSGAFESSAARDVGTRVLAELFGAGHRGHHPMEGSTPDSVRP